MRVTPTALPGVLILEPKVFGDERGFFLETFNQRAFDEAVGHHVEFVQDNHSRSQRGVLRGLHYQLPPHAQGKLVRVTSGRVFDVAVDMRRGSATFGRWVGHRAHAPPTQQQLWIPAGFAHGFLVLERERGLPLQDDGLLRAGRRRLGALGRSAAGDRLARSRCADPAVRQGPVRAFVRRRRRLSNEPQCATPLSRMTMTLHE